MPSANQASRSTDGSGSCSATKPPLAPTGTMTVFFTICALTRPSTSRTEVLAPRPQTSATAAGATLPKRRWTPSTRGE
ncbi:hypothetical protein SMICM304S_04296 [Streptomyces microflavus]